MGLTKTEENRDYYNGTVTNTGIYPIHTDGMFVGAFYVVPKGYEPPISTSGLYPFDGDVSSMDSPFIGVFSNDCSSITDTTIYVLKGSIIRFKSEAHISGDTTGLTGDGRVTGTLEGEGPLYVEDDHGEILTIIPVDPMGVLAFESDPVTDGILIPPGHHLVTFMYENHTNPDDIVKFVIAHQVVKHGDCAAFVEWRPESEVSDSVTIWCTVPTPHGHDVDAEDVWDFEQPIMSDTTLYWELESNIEDDGGEIVVPEL